MRDHCTLGTPDSSSALVIHPYLKRSRLYVEIVHFAFHRNSKIGMFTLGKFEMRDSSLYSLVGCRPCWCTGSEKGVIAGWLKDWEEGGHEGEDFEVWQSA